jgi:hypothetical protein
MEARALLHKHMQAYGETLHSLEAVLQHVQTTMTARLVVRQLACAIVVRMHTLVAELVVSPLVCLPADDLLSPHDVRAHAARYAAARWTRSSGLSMLASTCTQLLELFEAKVQSVCRATIHHIWAALGPAGSPCTAAASATAATALHAAQHLVASMLLTQHSGANTAVGPPRARLVYVTVDACTVGLHAVGDTSIVEMSIEDLVRNYVVRNGEQLRTWPAAWMGQVSQFGYELLWSQVVGGCHPILRFAAATQSRHPFTARRLFGVAPPIHGTPLSLVEDMQRMAAWRGARPSLPLLSGAALGFRGASWAMALALPSFGAGRVVAWSSFPASAVDAAQQMAVAHVLESVPAGAIDTLATVLAGVVASHAAPTCVVTVACVGSGHALCVGKGHFVTTVDTGRRVLPDADVLGVRVFKGVLPKHRTLAHGVYYHSMAVAKVTGRSVRLATHAAVVSDDTPHRIEQLCVVDMASSVAVRPLVALARTLSIAGARLACLARVQV